MCPFGFLPTLLSPCPPRLRDCPHWTGLPLPNLFISPVTSQLLPLTQSPVPCPLRQDPNLTCCLPRPPAWRPLLPGASLDLSTGQGTLTPLFVSSETSRLLCLVSSALHTLLPHVLWLSSPSQPIPVSLPCRWVPSCLFPSFIIQASLSFPAMCSSSCPHLCPESGLPSATNWLWVVTLVTACSWQIFILHPPWSHPLYFEVPTEGTEQRTKSPGKGEIP